MAQVSHYFGLHTTVMPLLSREMVQRFSEHSERHIFHEVIHCTHMSLEISGYLENHMMERQQSKRLGLISAVRSEMVAEVKSRVLKWN